MLALIDCNNFFVSCELIFRPELRGKAVVVITGNSGCVVARSEHAKKIGIPMCGPIFQYKDLVKAHNVAVFSGNMELYADISSRINAILKEFSPHCIPYSIDESFIELPDKTTDYRQIGIDIRKRLAKCLDIPVSVGIAPSRTLAKIACGIAKRYPEKTSRVCVLDQAHKIEKALKATPIEDVWGIGKKSAVKCRSIRIQTAYDMTRLSSGSIKNILGVRGVFTQRELTGENIASFTPEETGEPAQSVSHTRTFEKTTDDPEILRAYLASFCGEVGHRLRKSKLAASLITVFIQSNKHAGKSPQYSASHTFSFPEATSSDIELTKAASLILLKIYRSGYEYKRAGVILSELCSQDHVQRSLFYAQPQHREIMAVMDAVNDKYGDSLLRIAPARRPDSHKTSPLYTTRLDNALIIDI